MIRAGRFIRGCRRWAAVVEISREVTISIEIGDAHRAFGVECVFCQFGKAWIAALIGPTAGRSRKIVHEEEQIRELDTVNKFRCIQVEVTDD